MAWTSWSRTWATKRTTTTSRKPQKCSSKNMRWRRMYLHLQADQRPKQKHEDVLLLSHLQELYLSVKDLGLILSQKLVRLSIIQCRRHWPFFFVMAVLRREDDGAIEFWRLKDYLRNEFEYSQHWSDEEWNGRRRRQQEKISILYWSIRTRNSLLSSSPRSFRTQSHWSLITGQCVNFEQLLRVNLSHRMCNQFTFHHKFRIDTRRTNFEQKTAGILYVCGSYEQGTQRSVWHWSRSATSCMVQTEKVEKTSTHGVLGRYTTC